MNNNKYFMLFKSTFMLSTFTFGGGYVIIPLMKRKFVDELQWLDEDEMLDLIAIAQSSPGAVAVNASIIMGYRIAGIIGAFVSILGTVLPPLIIISVISMFYTTFRDNVVVNAVLNAMQAAVGAVIVDVVWNLGQRLQKEQSWIGLSLMVGAFVANYIFNVNIVWILLLCGFFGAIQTAPLFQRLRKEE